MNNDPIDLADCNIGVESWTDPRDELWKDGLPDVPQHDWMQDPKAWQWSRHQTRYEFRDRYLDDVLRTGAHPVLTAPEPPQEDLSYYDLGF